MAKVTAKDGTAIGFDMKGKGPPVILVEGAMGFRGLGFANKLQDLLAQKFSVYAYDRRGRGESGNTAPYALEREVEDIEALIEAAGGSAFVYGLSSGACLALEAAIRLDRKIKKLAMYEAPYNDDPASRQAWWGYTKELGELLAANRRGDAVALFMKLVGAPPKMIDGMRQSPGWPAMESVAPTLPYDAAAMGKDRAVPVERAARVSAATLVLDGGANKTVMPFMNASALALAKAIPHAQHRTLEGQTHAVEAEVLFPVLVEFFAG